MAAESHYAKGLKRLSLPLAQLIPALRWSGDKVLDTPASLFHMQDDEAEERALLEGEAQLDAGKYLPWKDVKRWLESWGSADELPPPKGK